MQGAGPAMKRLGNELLIIQGKKALPGATPHPVEGWTAAPAVNEAGEENLLLWNIVIDGPVGTPYEGGKFRCQLTFPPEFPNHAPQFAFLTEIFHPNLPKVCPVRPPYCPLLHHHHHHSLTFSSPSVFCNILSRSPGPYWDRPPNVEEHEVRARIHGYGHPAATGALHFKRL